MDIIGSIYDRIVNFINYKVIKESKKDGVVLGISGGIDSAVVAALSSIALGKNLVHGLLMPIYKSEHFTDALNIVGNLQINKSIIWINKIYDSFYSTGHMWGAKSKENIKARIRMCLLYIYACERNLIVIGTGNLTKITTGYFTKYGDGGCDIEPMGRILKRQVYELGRYYNMHSKYLIPERIFDKQPTAELKPDQYDVQDLGPYDVADRVVENYVFGKSDISDINKSDVDRVMNLINTTYHKRKIPPVPVLPTDITMNQKMFLKMITMNEGFFVEMIRQEIDNSNITDEDFRKLIRLNLGVVK